MFRIAIGNLLLYFCDTFYIDPIIYIWTNDEVTRNIISNSFSVILLNCPSKVTDVEPSIISFYVDLFGNIYIIMLVSLSYFVSCLIIRFYKRKNSNKHIAFFDPQKDNYIKGKYIFNFLFFLLIILFYDPYISLLRFSGPFFYILIPIVGGLFLILNFPKKALSVFKGDFLSKKVLKPTLAKIIISVIVISLSWIIYVATRDFFVFGSCDYFYINSSPSSIDYNLIRTFHYLYSSCPIENFPYGLARAGLYLTAAFVLYILSSIFTTFMANQISMMPKVTKDFFKPTISKIRLTLILGFLIFVAFGFLTGYFYKSCAPDEYPYPVPGRLFNMEYISPYSPRWLEMKWNDIRPFLETPCPPLYYDAVLVGSVRGIIVALYLTLIYFISCILLMVYKNSYSKDMPEQKDQKVKPSTKIIYSFIFLFIFVILYIPNTKELFYIYNDFIRKSNAPPSFTDDQKNKLTQRAIEIVANKNGIPMEILQIANAREGYYPNANKRVFSVKLHDGTGNIYGITLDENGKELNSEDLSKQDYEAKTVKYGKFDPNFYERLLLEPEDKLVTAHITLKMPQYDPLPRPDINFPDDGNNPSPEELEELGRKEKELYDSHFEPIFNSFVEKFKTKGYDFSNDRDGLYEVKMSFKELKEIQEWEEVQSIFGY